ncbi:MAG: glutaredoxin 3 [Candidatus Sedimenticola sp. (ex Thyasira tokunagai)]
MPKVVIYSTAICPYCVRAKQLLTRKGVEYEELYIDSGDRKLMREMLERSQRRTVPQIFIDDYHVGGYDDLAELNAFGKLDPLLGLAPHEEPEMTQEEDDIT